MAELSGREYRNRLITAMVAYAVVLAASLVVVEDLEQPWRTVVALAPVLPMVYVVWIVIGRFRALDEYWQQIQLTALPFAFLGTILLALTWGFVENAGFAPLSGFVWFLVMNLLYLVGLWLARRRYT